MRRAKAKEAKLPGRCRRERLEAEMNGEGRHNAPSKPIRAENFTMTSLSRIEAAISLLFVGQQSETHEKRPRCFEDKLKQDAEGAEEFISKQALGRGQLLSGLCTKKRRRKLHQFEAEIESTGRFEARRLQGHRQP
jgi:hypothetical protein